ncbi:MAG: hypothetical protein BWY32_01227 [bacterium ADurb.Bin243]|nr:MAG: hypothetical protein BWY32_01227 [bacterium ADurb.Bin243]
MKKTIVLFILVFMSGVLGVWPAAVMGESDAGWKIDSEMKFSFGYLPPVKKTTHGAEGTEKIEKPSDMGFSSPFLPDITNIALKDFIGMGFAVPAPEDAHKYNFFIKLFNFPGSFKPERSSMPIIEGYFLDKLVEGRTIISYVSDAKNLAVKLCYIAKSDTVFTKENPYPHLSVKVQDEAVQSSFNVNTVFSSLYLNPRVDAADESSEAGLARHSAEGVLAFHGELVKMYGEKLIPMANASDDKHLYFGKASSEGLSVIKIPLKPLVFENWRNLPMPQGPTNIFLSGLLLLYKYDYVLKDGVKAGGAVSALDSPEFKAKYKKISGHVLEIASVIKIKK